MDKNLIKSLYTQILCEIEGIDDPSKLREGLKGTPKRIANMFDEIFEGYNDNDDNLIMVFAPKYDKEEVVISKNIKFYSLCEHHMLPFYGSVDIAYLASRKKLIGISKLSRIVDKFAHRLNIQEQMTNDICKFIFESELEPRGVMVIAEAIHLCEVMRGVKKDGVRMITSSAQGEVLKNSELRNEILFLLNRR